MKKKTDIVMVLVACVFLWPVERPAWAEETVYTEYEIKAAFMYQSVNFIDGWRFQQENNKENDRSIRIGIIGNNPFRGAFEPLKEKQTKGRNVTIKYFKGLSELNRGDEKVTLHPAIDQIKQCDLVFICSSEERYIDNILDPIRHERILTIADTQDFLENGGIINFIMEQKKVRFEINTAAAHRAKLEIRSKLLRLAKRVLKADNVKDR